MKNDNSKKSFILVIASALIMLIMVGSLTYAYFTADVTANNTLKVTTTVSDTFSPIITSYPDGNLSLTVTSASMLNTEASADNTTVAATASQSFNVSLLADGATCTYSLALKNTGTAYTPSPNASSAGLKEYTIKVTDSAGTVLLEEKTVDSIMANATTDGGILVEGLTLTSNEELDTEVYTITATIYNLNVSQNIYNKRYSSTVGVTAITCE